MIIECPKCSKKFNISDNLIPENGRLLKCGKCENTWFYNKKEKIINNENVETKKVDNVTKQLIEELRKEPKIKKKKINKTKHIKIKQSTSKELVSVSKNDKDKEGNITKKIFVIIISLLAFILLIDTFKIQISSFFPEIIMTMDSLYIVINDLKLFFKDLVR